MEAAGTFNFGLLSELRLFLDLICFSLVMTLNYYDLILVYKFNSALCFIYLLLFKVELLWGCIFYFHNVQTSRNAVHSFLYVLLKNVLYWVLYHANFT